MEGALRERLAAAQLHHNRGHDQENQENQENQEKPGDDTRRNQEING